MHLSETHYRLLDTPTGPFAVLVAADGSISTTWVDSQTAKRLETLKHDPLLVDDVAERLVQYFAGHAVDFSDIATPRGSDFHRRCWDACRAVPRGSTCTYGELAAAAGSPAGAARAAGQAMRNNPLPIIVPCHRVIAAGGGLGGFAGSNDVNGAELGHKRFLLELERAGEAALTPA